MNEARAAAVAPNATPLFAQHDLEAFPTEQAVYGKVESARKMTPFACLVTTLADSACARP
jgi:hypothetical protein